MNIVEILRLGPVVPVLVIERVEDAVPLARALVAGGIRVLEVTLRTPPALEAVRQIAADVPDAVVGVGTVIDPGQLGEASEAGARFAVSPGLTRRLADAASESDMPYLPAGVTPSEVIAAVDLGFETLKFFPAEPSGGVPALRALASVFPDVRFCPTGGIGPGNLDTYLALGNVVAVGGSWLAPPEVVRGGDWAKVTQLAQEAAGRGR